MILTDNARTRLFWMICIPLRVTICFLLTLLLYHFETEDAVRFAVAGYLFLTALGFIFSAVLQAIGTKQKGGLGGKIWWTTLRYAHISIYVTTAALVLLKVQYIPLLLLLDIFFGIFGKIYLT